MFEFLQNLMVCLIILSVSPIHIILIVAAACIHSNNLSGINQDLEII